MCGIAGWFGKSSEEPSRIKPIADALHHRGPDALGVKSFADATLIHTRLSIIDLSPAGAQPMCNEDGSVWTVFNGEIYNHQELRHHLQARGHVFKGRADTEVLVHLYEEDGAAFLHRLRGMFALAIYDQPHQRLLLARDRLGIKPLFYAITAGRLAFASEIPALRLLPEVNTNPDLQALSDFLALSFVPAPQTFFQGIRALEPGQWLEAGHQHGRLAWALKRYHDWNIRVCQDQSFPRVVDHAEGLIHKAVQSQLESDVPMGCLLSGGIDSSLVSASAQRDGSEPIRTFNVRFAEAAYDETWAASAVAQHIGSVHKTLDMPRNGGTWETVTDLLQRAGQPYADTSVFAANAVCRLMRQQVVVALSGDGGDEGFGGYERFRRIKPLRLWGKVPSGLGHRLAKTLNPFVKLGLVQNRLPNHLSALAGRDDVGVLEYLLCWIRADEHRELLAGCQAHPVRRLFETRWRYELPKRASALEKLSAQATEVGIRLILANDYLFKVDLASMRESLEVRVPLLDEDLFDFALSLPHKFKVEGGFCKRVLRAVAERELPSTVARKPKQGFMIPVDTWVDLDFKRKLKATLLGPESALAGLFNPQPCRKLVEAFCADQPVPGISREGLYQRIIMLLAVHLALRPNALC
jgi:asparagine synthase (glutamine-hydrolysing)